MNTMELKQALFLLKGYIEEPEYQKYDNYDELEDSVNNLTAFLEQKLESKTPFTTYDLEYTLECFSNIRGHINVIDGKSAYIPSINVAPLFGADDSFVASEDGEEEIANAAGEENPGDVSFQFSPTEEKEPEKEEVNDNNDGPDLDLDVDLPGEGKKEEKKEEPKAEAGKEVEAQEAKGIPTHFVKDLLSQVENTIANIDCTKNLSLDQCIANISGNSVTLDREPDYKGSASSKRNMITMKYENGEEVKGYFTAESGVYDLDKNHKYENILRAALVSDKYKNNENVKKFVNKVLASPNGASDLLMSMVVSNSKYDKTNPIINEGFNEKRLGAFFDEKKEGAFLELEKDPALKELVIGVRNEVTDAEMSDISRIYYQYQDNIEAESGSIIAGRNVAMSNVANVLGVPSIVAKSVMATANWNGKTIKGVFTENVEGNIIPTDVKSDELKYTDAMTVTGTTAKYKMDLADLQVLDYICGNVDRHQSNFTFIVKDGKLAGVKGFDNDFSFGTEVAKDNSVFGNAVALDDITVITEHMAKALINLDDDTLKAALSGTGLGEKEIKACVERKNRIQDRVKHDDKPFYKAGSVHVIKDALWNSASIEDISKNRVNPNVGKNIFGNAVIISEEIKRLQKIFGTKPADKAADMAKIKAAAEAMEKNGEAKPGEAAKEEKPKDFTVGTRRDEISPEAFKEKIDNLKAFAKNLKNASGFFSVKHQQYTDLLKALNKAKEFENKPVTDYKVRSDFNDYLKDLDKKVDEYIIYKKGKGEPNEIGKRRLEIAEKVKAYVTEEKTIFQDASRSYMEKKLEEDAREYLEEKAKYDKVISVLAEKTVEHHGVGREEDKEILTQKAMGLIKESRLVGQIIGKRIDEFVGLAENNHAELFKRFEILLYDYTEGARHNETRTVLENEAERQQQKAERAQQRANANQEPEEEEEEINTSVRRL